MKDFELKGYKIEDFSFVNNIKGVQRLELGHKYSYNVRYAKNNNTCIGSFTAEIADKANPDAFSLKLTLSGQFTIEPDVAKEILHVKTYDALFPYVKAVVSTFTVNAGIPPIYIPYLDISEKSIYRVDMPGIEPRPSNGSEE